MCSLYDLHLFLCVLGIHVCVHVDVFAFNTCILTMACELLLLLLSEQFSHQTPTMPAHMQTYNNTYTRACYAFTWFHTLTICVCQHVEVADLLQRVLASLKPKLAHNDFELASVRYS